MKKKTETKKLVLAKETLLHLERLRLIHGGVTFTDCVSQCLGFECPHEYSRPCD